MNFSASSAEFLCALRDLRFCFLVSESNSELEFSPVYLCAPCGLSLINVVREWRNWQTHQT